LVFGIVFLVALPPTASPRVELHVDLKQRVNAVYHLACLAGTISCTTDAFERFWKASNLKPLNARFALENLRTLAASNL
jgi:hypothetical protein